MLPVNAVDGDEFVRRDARVGCNVEVSGADETAVLSHGAPGREKVAMPGRAEGRKLSPLGEACRGRAHGGDAPRAARAVRRRANALDPIFNHSLDILRVRGKV